MFWDHWPEAGPEKGRARARKQALRDFSTEVDGMVLGQRVLRLEVEPRESLHPTPGTEPSGGAVYPREKAQVFES